MATSAPYHHGDLRTALLAAALAMLADGGAAALTLRGVARAAGVSAMAPYHHFADRAALVAAVATIGFERLYAEKLAALAAAPAGPRAALIAGTRAYVAFILANPELYRLMKGSELADRRAYPDLAAAAALPSRKLAALIAGLGPLRVDAAMAAEMLWAFAHGLGLLAIDGYLGNHADVLARAEAGAAALLDGWAVR
ncbi:MAG: TetR family transcriptional regulator [Alphaproteobacteria bacterium PA4]|nr:MAG: TetR family transcriptional regulator [Alphaproteobacteria bacterium PA4]